MTCVQISWPITRAAFGGFNSSSPVTSLFTSFVFFRIELQRENRDRLVPKPALDRAMSAPPNLGHSKSNNEHHRMPRHQGEVSIPADRSNCGSVAVDYAKYAGDVPQTNPKNTGGTASADFHASSSSISRYSLYSQSRDVSGNTDNMGLAERRDQEFFSEPNVFSGKASTNLFHLTSNREDNSGRDSSATQRFQTDSFLYGRNRTRDQSVFPDARMQDSFSRQYSDRVQRFSLYSEAQSRGESVLDDDVMSFREHRVEKGGQDRYVDNYKVCCT